jgi:hypothetical protein
MKVGDLIKFVGHANFYKGHIGIVCEVFENCAQSMIYFPDAIGQGRVSGSQCVLHPMHHDELKVI